jgi:hypothetical protein
MGLGVVDLAIGILALIPLSLGARDKLMKTAFYEGFKVCLATGAVALALAGVLVIIT